eukprot:UN25553
MVKMQCKVRGLNWFTGTNDQMRDRLRDYCQAKTTNLKSKPDPVKLFYEGYQNENYVDELKILLGFEKMKDLSKWLKDDSSINLNIIHNHTNSSQGQIRGLLSRLISKKYPHVLIASNPEKNEIVLRKEEKIEDLKNYLKNDQLHELSLFLTIGPSANCLQLTDVKTVDGEEIKKHFETHSCGQCSVKVENNNVKIIWNNFDDNDVLSKKTMSINRH